QAKDEITSDDVGTVKISGNFVTASGSGLIQSGRTVVGKYVANGYQIPKNSFFYTDAVASESEAATTEFSNIPDGYTIYRLPVTFHSTYGCSIMEGDYIDLYFKAKDVNGTNSSNIIYGLFIKSIQVLKVVDKDGNDVFTNTDDDDQMVPKYIEFAVPIEYFTLLRKASLIPADTELIPVPRNAGYSENPEDTTIASEAIENFILALSSSYGIE
ncbi:MAG TPA: hypothetical protein PLC25_02535, partial [Bacilli bacterium]|nr:hypothetical protein [Bacilli bacterium]